MTIVVVGGSGLVGKQLVAMLQQEHGQDSVVVAASPSLGVNTITGEGLAAALVGATVVIDVTNAPSIEDAAVLEFFETSSRNLLAAEKEAGTVRHHICLSIVGADRITDSGYMRAKVAQENILKSSGIPYTILRATQFFEFLGIMAHVATDQETQTVRVPVGAMMQPVLSKDVAAALVDIALSDDKPVNGTTIDIAGPDRLSMEEALRHLLQAQKDPRTVVADSQARYFGAALDEDSLVPIATHDARLGATHLEDWLKTL